MKKLFLSLSLLFALACGAHAQVSKYDIRIATDVNKVSDDGLVWIDGKELPLESKICEETSTYYGRIPKDYMEKVSAGIQSMSDHATGQYLLFQTDSKRVSVKWEVEQKEETDPFIPPQGMYGVDVYVRLPKDAWGSMRSLTGTGAWKFLKNGRLNQVISPVTNKPESWDQTTVDVPGEGVRPVMIYLPTRGKLKWVEVGVEPNSVVKNWAHESGVMKPVVHYGTSIVHGGCASRPGLCYTNQAARFADVPYVNLGFSGQALLETPMAEVMAKADASLYIVDPVWNADENVIRARCETFLKRLHQLRPNTPILLCEGIVPQAERFEPNVAIKEVYEKIMAEGGSLAKCLKYLPSDGLIAQDGESTHDYCHPNDWGSVTMGVGYAKKIIEILNIR